MYSCVFYVVGFYISKKKIKPLTNVYFKVKRKFSVCHSVDKDLPILCWRLRSDWLGAVQP